MKTSLFTAMRNCIENGDLFEAVRDKPDRFARDEYYLFNLLLEKGPDAASKVHGAT